MKFTWKSKVSQRWWCFFPSMTWLWTNSSALAMGNDSWFLDATRIIKQPEYAVVQRGSTVSFECKVKHDHTLIPTITWLKDNGELPNDGRYLKTISCLSLPCLCELLWTKGLLWSDLAGMFSKFLRSALSKKKVHFLLAAKCADLKKGIELLKSDPENVCLSLCVGLLCNSGWEKPFRAWMPSIVRYLVQWSLDRCFHYHSANEQKCDHFNQ